MWPLMRNCIAARRRNSQSLGRPSRRRTPRGTRAPPRPPAGVGQGLGQRPAKPARLGGSGAARFSARRYNDEARSNARASDALAAASASAAGPGVVACPAVMDAELLMVGCPAHLERGWRAGDGSRRAWWGRGEPRPSRGPGRDTPRSGHRPTIFPRLGSTARFSTTRAWPVRRPRGRGTARPMPAGPGFPKPRRPPAAAGIVGQTEHARPEHLVQRDRAVFGTSCPRQLGDEQRVPPDSIATASARLSVSVQAVPRSWRARRQRLGRRERLDRQIAAIEPLSTRRAEHVAEARIFGVLGSCSKLGGGAPACREAGESRRGRPGCRYRPTAGRRSPRRAGGDRPASREARGCRRGRAAQFLRVGHVHRAARSIGHGLARDADRKNPCSGPTSRGNDRRDLVRRQVTQMTAQRVDHAVERLVRHRLALVTPPRQHNRLVFAREYRINISESRRLADPRGAMDVNDDGLPLRGACQGVGQRRALGLAADEHGLPAL